MYKKTIDVAAIGSLYSASVPKKPLKALLKEAVEQGAPRGKLIKKFDKMLNQAPDISDHDGDELGNYKDKGAVTRIKAYFTIENVSDHPDVNFYGTNAFIVRDDGDAVESLPIEFELTEVRPLSRKIKALGNSQGARVFNEQMVELAKDGETTQFEIDDGQGVSDFYVLDAYGDNFHVLVFDANDVAKVKGNLLALYYKQASGQDAQNNNTPGKNGHWGDYDANSPLSDIVSAYITSLVG